MVYTNNNNNNNWREGILFLFFFFLSVGFRVAQFRRNRSASRTKRELKWTKSSVLSTKILPLSSSASSLEVQSRFSSSSSSSSFHHLLPSSSSPSTNSTATAARAVIILLPTAAVVKNRFVLLRHKNKIVLAPNGTAPHGPARWEEIGKILEASAIQFHLEDDVVVVVVVVQYGNQ